MNGRNRNRSSPRRRAGARSSSIPGPGPGAYGPARPRGSGWSSAGCWSHVVMLGHYARPAMAPLATAGRVRPVLHRLGVMWLGRGLGTWPLRWPGSGPRDARACGARASACSARCWWQVDGALTGRQPRTGTARLAVSRWRGLPAGPVYETAAGRADRKPPERPPTSPAFLGPDANGVLPERQDRRRSGPRRRRGVVWRRAGRGRWGGGLVIVGNFAFTQEQRDDKRVRLLATGWDTGEPVWGPRGRDAGTTAHGRPRPRGRRRAYANGPAVRHRPRPGIPQLPGPAGDRAGGVDGQTSSVRRPGAENNDHGRFCASAAGGPATRVSRLPRTRARGGPVAAAYHIETGAKLWAGRHGTGPANASPADRHARRRCGKSCWPLAPASPTGHDRRQRSGCCGLRRGANAEGIKRRPAGWSGAAGPGPRSCSPNQLRQGRGNCFRVSRFRRQLVGRGSLEQSHPESEVLDARAVTGDMSTALGTTASSPANRRQGPASAAGRDGPVRARAKCCWPADRLIVQTGGGAGGAGWSRRRRDLRERGRVRGADGARRGTRVALGGAVAAGAEWTGRRWGWRWP